MRRIFHATAVASRPAVPGLAGVEGYFTNGNPAGSVPATVVPDWWLNQQQEELASVILAAGLTLDANNLAQLLAAIRALTPTAINVVTYVASATYVPNAKLIYAIIEGVGGGAGGGAASGGANGSAAGGGGAAAYSRILLTKAAIGASRLITVGAGGAGGASGSASGSNGGSTIVAGIMTMNGGAGGQGAGNAAVGGGGIGGATGGGSLAIPGQEGGLGILNGSTGAGGAGGASFFGFGGPTTSILSPLGAAGVGYGSGGGGGGASTNLRAGGAGQQGIVIITEFCGS